MYRTYTKAIKEVCKRIEESLKDLHQPVKASSLGDLVRILDEKPVLMMRFPTRELKELVEVPCPGTLLSPVTQPTDKNSQPLIRSFKKLRDFYDLKESTACLKCPHQDSCPFKFRLPNKAKDAGVQDVFNVLLAYEDFGREVQKREQIALDTVEVSAAEQSPEDLSREDKLLKLSSIYGLKYRAGLNILNTFEIITEEYLDDKNFRLEKFENAIREFEFESKEADGQQRSLKPREETLPPRQPEEPSNRELYLKKLDDGSSSDPIYSTGGKMIPKQKIKEKEVYVDVIKKKADTAVNVHFMKQAKFKPKIDPEREFRKGRFDRSTGSRVVQTPPDWKVYKKNIQADSRGSVNFLKNEEQPESQDPFREETPRRPKSSRWTQRPGQGEGYTPTHRDEEGATQDDTEPASTPTDRRQSHKHSKQYQPRDDSFRSPRPRYNRDENQEAESDAVSKPTRFSKYQKKGESLERHSAEGDRARYQQPAGDSDYKPRREKYQEYQRDDKYTQDGRKNSSFRSPERDTPSFRRTDENHRKWQPKQESEDSNNRDEPRPQRTERSASHRAEERERPSRPYDSTKEGAQQESDRRARPNQSQNYNRGYSKARETSHPNSDRQSARGSGAPRRAGDSTYRRKPSDERTDSE